MIFVGGGSHLGNALKHTFAIGYKIDYGLSVNDEFKEWSESRSIHIREL